MLWAVHWTTYVGFSEWVIVIAINIVLMKVGIWTAFWSVRENANIMIYVIRVHIVAYFVTHHRGGETVRCTCDDLHYQSTHCGLLCHTSQGGWNCQVYMWWFMLSKYTSWCTWSHITGGVDLSSVHVMVYTIRVYVIRVHIVAYFVTHHRGGETVRCTCDDLHYQSTHHDVLGHTSQRGWTCQIITCWQLKVRCRGVCVHCQHTLIEALDHMVKFCWTIVLVYQCELKWSDIAEGWVWSCSP